MGDLAEEAVRMLADMGRAVAERLGDWRIALIVVLLSWCMWPVAAALLTILVAYIYCSSRGAAPAGKSGNGSLLAAFGCVLVFIGAYWLLVDIVKPAVPWPVHVIAVGAVLLLLGLAWGGAGGQGGA